MKTGEEWREILARHYMVSNLARVMRNRPGMSTYRGKILKPRIKNGYLVITLSVCGVMAVHFIHKMVAEAFLGPCPAGYRVAWRDGDRTNCRLENLHYVPKKGAKHVTPARADFAAASRGDYHGNRKSFETGF